MKAFRVSLKILATAAIVATALDSSADSHTRAAQPINHASRSSDFDARSKSYLCLDEVIHSALQSFPAVLAASKRREMATGEKLAAEGGFDTIIKMYSRSSLAGQYQNENVDVGFEQPTEYWGATFFGGYRRGVGKYPV